MKLFSFILMLIAVVSTEATFIHKDIEIRACSDTEKEHMIGTDGEETIHSDFNRKEEVVTLPDFADKFTYYDFYDFSVVEMETCKNNLAIFAKGYKNPVEQIDPPQTSMYSKDNVQPDVENTLICHVTGFFPPPITVSWTKNNINVTDNIKVSQYRPNSDGTYNFFSYLKFVPEEGDIYTCTVNHKSLQEPQTKTWGFRSGDWDGHGRIVHCLRYHKPQENLYERRTARQKKEWMRCRMPKLPAESGYATKEHGITTQDPA